MAYSSLLSTYLGSGLFASRPVAATIAATIPPGWIGLWVATDTGALYSIANGDAAWTAQTGASATVTTSLSSAISTVDSTQSTSLSRISSSLSTTNSTNVTQSTSLSQISSSLSGAISSTTSLSTAVSTVISGSTSAVNSRVDSLSTAVGGAGGLTTVGHPGALNGVESPAVNFYIGRRIIVPADISISKVGFSCRTAAATAVYQPFIYLCSADDITTTLMASGVQVTGTTAGYNEAPLSAPASLLKGKFYVIGVSVITHGIDNLHMAADGVGFFVANGSSSVPASPAPGSLSPGPSIYGFWGVA